MFSIAFNGQSKIALPFDNHVDAISTGLDLWRYAIAS